MARPQVSAMSLRLFTVIGLVILLIPIFVLSGNLVYERSQTYNEAVREVGSKWGGQQTVAGPVLAVKDRFSNDYYHFLPEELNITASADSELRARGQYKVPLYEGEFKFTGYFNPLNSYGATEADLSRLDANNAYILIGLSDSHGLVEQVNLNWSQNNVQFGSSTKGTSVDKGISASVPIDVENYSRRDFEINLKLRGSESLFFAPLGRTTTVGLSSDWSSPSFDGNFLPTEHEITETGFTASWKTLDLNRTIPQFWKEGDRVNVNVQQDYYRESTSDNFGLNFYVPVDIYQKTTRSVKYGIAVVALVFFSFFMVEATSHRRVHPVQYLLIGLALAIFYTLLLSFAEFINFGLAYLIATIATISLIGLFTRTVLKEDRLALVMSGILTLLYLFIYILLQMEDYTLLVGSIGTFFILAFIMYSSRKINWYGN